MKLWQDGRTGPDGLVEAYTAADDAVLDNRLVEMDVAVNAAQARMLEACGFLDRGEAAGLLEGLRQILDEYRKGGFLVSAADEDVHTKIENTLTARVGEAGKKIHTGRSRNDQVLTDLRLFCKQGLLSVTEQAVALAGQLVVFAVRHQTVPMPGYTHMQRAMPSSVGLWAGAFAEALKDDVFHLLHCLEYADACPLGSGAGYGVSLPLDRPLVARLLGFARLQTNPIYCQNSRGKIEGVVLGGLSNLMLTMGRVANDLLLFTTSEYGFFRVPDRFCTGSSIMPQKKNLDLMELLRARVRTVLSHEQLVKSIPASLPSGYSRDLQETKRPLIESFDIVSGSLGVLEALFTGLEVDAARMRAAMDAGLYATDAAFELVRSGVPFREAYLRIKQGLAGLEGREPQVRLDPGATPGTPANPGLLALGGLLEELRTRVGTYADLQRQTLAALLDPPGGA